nr:helix-turn-helix transcriptional regulator [Vagococcus allomyrinae]
MIKELRLAKRLNQGELSERANVSRQYICEIENGHRRQLNLVKIQDLVNGCGEQLFVTTSYANPLQISDQTEKEDQILRAFAEGKTELAEELLGDIRGWRYPTEHIVAKCKRNMAVAISYHFRGLPNYAHGKMNNLIAGLSYLDCGEEAEYFAEMFYRIIKNGDKELYRMYLETQKGVSS